MSPHLSIGYSRYERNNLERDVKLNQIKKIIISSVRVSEWSSSKKELLNRLTVHVCSLCIHVYVIFHFSFEDTSCKRVRVMKTHLHSTLIYYIVKLGFTGVYIFLIFALKHRSLVLVRTASLRRRTASLRQF